MEKGKGFGCKTFDIEFCEGISDSQLQRIATDLKQEQEDAEIRGVKVTVKHFKFKQTVEALVKLEPSEDKDMVLDGAVFFGNTSKGVSDEDILQIGETIRKTIKKKVNRVVKSIRYREVEEIAKAIWDESKSG